MIVQVEYEHHHVNMCVKCVTKGVLRVLESLHWFHSMALFSLNEGL